MDRPRRVRSPPFGYDPRMMGRAESRGPPEYDDLYASGPPFDPGQPAPPFAEPHTQYSAAYRDHRLPSTYRATLREPYQGPASAPYKILCITNINHKVSDGPVKEALISDFCRFGDISVSICHDSGERLAYIYFRSYEDAREARHAKARTLLFDRPIEIEPIYEPKSSPIESSPPPQVYQRRRSMTPPEYYGINGPVPPSSRRPIPHHRGLSPPINYQQPSRYPPGPMQMQPAPMPYGRYYLPPSHIPPTSPYSSPPYEPYRSYHSHPPPHPPHLPPGLSYPPPYGPPMVRERDRPINEGHLTRSPRSEAYYPPMDQRSYPPPIPQHSSRTNSSIHSSSSHNQLTNPPHVHHQSSSFSNRRSPPHLEHPRYTSRESKREKFSIEPFGQKPEDGKPSRVLFITNIDTTKSETDVQEVFEAFGLIEDVELKKINSEFSSALIRFSSMDCAYKAKTAMNGKYLGNIKCRIAYGKVSASRRLWIGGLGPLTTLVRLEDEFSKYGNIMNLDYISGRPYAYIEFETASQAQFATHHLRGTRVADAERNIRIEYVDQDRNEKPASKQDPNLQVSELSSRSRTTNESWSTNEHEVSPPNNRKRSISPADLDNKRHAQSRDPSTGKSMADIRTNSSKVPPLSPSNSPNEFKAGNESSNELNNNQDTARRLSDNSRSTVQDATASDFGSTGIDGLNQCKSIRDIVDCCSISWFGQLVLRNFNFPSRMFMCSGEKITIEKYITKLDDENGDHCPILKITQRWRLHPQPKLEEVKRRMQSGNVSMLIITAKPDQSPTLSSPTCKTPQSSTSQACKVNGEKEVSVDEKADAGESSITQPRPLKNLISYLEQKDAAGVISLNALNGEQTDGSKLLYAFPPGDFALNLLKRKAPHLTPDTLKEEFLLGVIVGGTETKI